MITPLLVKVIRDLKSLRKSIQRLEGVAVELDIANEMLEQIKTMIKESRKLETSTIELLKKCKE